MVQDYDDFDGYLELIKCYLNFFDNQFDFWIYLMKSMKLLILENNIMYMILVDDDHIKIYKTMFQNYSYTSKNVS